jgi:hypothetical protein
MLDVTDRLVVIVGGGPVAARKAAGVLEAGATRVRCVAPAFDPAVPETVERVEETSRRVTLGASDRLELLLALGESWRVAGRIREAAAVLDRAVSMAAAAAGDPLPLRTPFAEFEPGSRGGAAPSASASLLNDVPASPRRDNSHLAHRRQQ